MNTRQAPALDCLAAVALGGALGALLRHLIGVAVASGWPDPTAAVLSATWAINVVGSGLLAALPAVPAIARRPALSAGLGAGVLGGFTTFSAYAGHARDLLAAGRPGLAGAYLLGTVLGCLAAVLVVRSALGPTGRSAEAPPSEAPPSEAPPSETRPQGDAR